HRDADSDGFGAILPTAVASCSASVPPPGYLSSATDCCDTESRAYPGATAYYSSPRNGCGGYDYDCNTVEDLAPSALGNACSCSSVCFAPSIQCYSGTPACGSSIASCGCSG